MKKILFALLMVAAFSGYGQTLDSLRNYNNRWIRNSAINAFTNLRLNTLINGMLNQIDTAKDEGGVDYSLLDTVYYRTATSSNATPFNIDTLYSANNRVVVYDLDVTSVDTSGAVNSWLKRVVVRNKAGVYTVLTSGNITFLDSQSSGLSVDVSGGIPVVQFTGLTSTVKWVYALRPKSYLSL